MARLLPLLLVLAACASGPSLAGAGARNDDPGVARGLAWSHTYEVRYDDDQRVAGYIVEFFRVPLGVVDERSFDPGTVLVQDRDFQTLGFITPGAHAFVHGPDGNSRDLGYGGRDEQVAAIMGRSGRPRYQSIAPAVPRPQD